MIDNKLYFKNLDSIRFIAALMVFLGHALSPSYQYLNIKNSIGEKLLNIISNGGTGVSVFFVLSGFLITFLLITEYEITKKIALKKFYMRRILRIWPLYFLVVFFSFLIYPFLKSLLGINNPLGSNIFYHLAFLSNFDVINIEKFYAGSDAMSQNITWSVSIEEQFYLFWPLIFLCFPKRLWIYCILFVMICSLLFRLLHNDDAITLYFHTFSVLLDLAIGGFMAYLIKEFPKIRVFFEKCSTLTHLTLVIFSFSLLYWSEFINTLAYGLAMNRIFISFSFALIISAQAITKKESLLNFSNLTFASKWGKYTYGIYLIHPIVLTIINVLFRSFQFCQTSFISVLSISIIEFILTLILSKISYRYYESRFLLLKNNYISVSSTKSATQ